MSEIKNKKIIYIIGAGRSGTTLLEIILGNAENIFNTGELNRYAYRRGLAVEREPGTPAYQFWEKIRNKLSNKYDLQEQEKLHEQFEYHASFFKKMIGIKPDKVQYEKYKNFLSDLYEVIFSEIESPCITDSSKYPGRAMNLSGSVPYDICYIYIKRDPVNVVHSFAKKDVEQISKGWLFANLYYFIVNTLCKIAVSKLKRRHKVSVIKYEEMILNPMETISLVEEDLQLDLSKIKEKLIADEYFIVNPYLFDANRIRLKTTLKVQKPKAKQTLSFSDHATKLVNMIHYP